MILVATDIIYNVRFPTLLELAYRHLLSLQLLNPPQQRASMPNGTIFSNRAGMMSLENSPPAGFDLLALYHG